jgi:hypothetical protein
MLLDGVMYKLVDLLPISKSLLISLISTCNNVIKPIKTSLQEFKFALEELLEKILAKETVVVLSSPPQTSMIPSMLLSSE